MDDRLFDEKAVARILRRTAELQGARQQQPATGLSLEELKTLAAESGLDPDLIQAAVTELHTEKTAEASRWWGGPTSIVVEQQLPVEIDDLTWERMLDMIRTTLSEPGVVDIRGSTREWTQETKDGNQSQLSARNRDGRTHLRMYRNTPVLPALLYIFYAIGTFISGLIVFIKSAVAVTTALPIWLAVIASLFFLIRWIISRSAAAERRKITRLMSELTTLAMQSVPTREPGEPSAAILSAGRVSLPDPEDADADEQERTPGGSRFREPQR